MSLAAPVAVAVAVALTPVAIAALLMLRSFRITAVCAEFFRSYTLPHGRYDSLRKRRPGLTLKDCPLAGPALGWFFMA